MAGYEDGWKNYRRIRNQWLLIFLGYVPVVGIVGLVSITLFNTFAPAFVTAFIWMALLLFAGIRVNAWPCPRCGKWFSGKWWYNKGFLARRCVHCGLPKYQYQ